MKKKILVVIALIAILGGLFVLTGCETNKVSDNNGNSSLNTSGKEIEVNGVKFKLDKEDDYGSSFKYKYSSSFKEDYLGTTRFYYLSNQDDNRMVEIRVNSSYTTPQQILAEKESNYSNDNTTNVKSENKMINEKEWVYIEYNNTQKDINYINHEYYCNFGDDNYCVIIFRIDSSVNDLNGINELENEFIYNISFN